jgi:predicted DNA-binding transcriptional regulator YafY
MTMNRLERLYAVNEAIKRAGPTAVSASELAERFEVTRRTIERDINALRAAGVPLFAEYGRNGGHITLDRPGNVILALSPPEVTALLIAVAASGKDMPFRDAGTTAAARLLDHLSPTTRLSVDALRSRIRVREQPTIATKTRRTLEEALRRSVVVNLDYQDSKDNRTTRPVDPVGFYNGNDGWYLIGWCHLRKSGRIFRLDRVTSARLTSKPAVVHEVDATLGWVPGTLRSP